MMKRSHTIDICLTMLVVGASCSVGEKRTSAPATTNPTTPPAISTIGPAVPHDLLTLEREAAKELGDAQPTSVQVVKTTLAHAEGVLFNAAASVSRNKTQSVWVVIMKGHFADRDAQLAPGDMSIPTGNTSAAISSSGSHGLLDGSIGNYSANASDIGGDVTTVSW